MRYLKYSVLIIVLTAGMASCKKSFLDVPVNNIVEKETYVKDLSTLNNFLYGMYISFSAEFSQGYNVIYPELVADNIKTVSGSSYLVSHYNWNQQATSTGGSYPDSKTTDMTPLWKMGYQIIRSSSFIIDKAKQFRNEDPAKADDILAQAYAFRAFIHFILINTFAQPFGYTADATHSGIPYVMTSDWTQPVSRQTVAEVYNNIISDFNSAIPLFKPGTFNKLYINQNAAKALLARVYLFKNDYAAAKNLAREILNNVPLMGSGDYPSKLFTGQDSESFFHIKPEISNYVTFMAGLFFSPNYNLQFLATNDIADILKEDSADVRNVWVKGSAGNWQISKFPAGVEPSFPVAAGSYYSTIIRSSEMCLTASEAYAQLNNEDSARAFLDLIRLRANPAATPTNASGAALLDSIYKERRKELCFESLRMYDLLRWKKSVTRVDVTSGAPATLSYPNDKAIAPLSMLDVTNSGLQQNPGY